MSEQKIVVFPTRNSNEALDTTPEQLLNIVRIDMENEELHPKKMLIITVDEGDANLSLYSAGTHSLEALGILEAAKSMI